MERPEMQRKKPTVYPVELKRSAAQLVTDEQRSCADVGRELGICSRLISRWVQEYKREGMEAFPQKGYLPPSDEKLRQMEAKLRRVTMERDILKKAIAYFAEVPK